MIHLKKKLSFLTSLSLIFTLFALCSIETVQATGNSVLSKTQTLAKQGKVINSPFSIGTKTGPIKKAYGPPDFEDETLLDYYPSKQVAFQIQDNLVFKTFSIASEFQGIADHEVEKELGKPHCAEGGFGKTYWSYHLGDYLLTFQFRNTEVRILEQVMVEKDRTCKEV